MGRFRLALLALLLVTGTVLGAGLLASHPATLLGRAVASLAADVGAVLGHDVGQGTGRDARSPPAWRHRLGAGDESALGAALAHEADSAFGTSHPWHRYLNELVSHLAVRSQRPLTYRVYVAPGPPRVAGLAGGVLVVGDRLLPLVASEAELVALLAQAMGHVDLGHGLDAARAELAAGDRSDARFFRALAARPYSAAQETEADDDALRALQAEGYDPLALGRALGRLVPTFPELAARADACTARARAGLEGPGTGRIYLGTTNLAKHRTRWEKDYLAEYAP